MKTRTHRRHWFWLFGILALLVGVYPRPAHAGSSLGLRAASPAPGAVVIIAPNTIRLDFSQAPPDTLQVGVLNSQGQSVATAPASIRGTMATIPLHLAAPGVYTVLAGPSSYTFTYWHGGALPPSLLEAAAGGPSTSPIRPLVQWSWALCALESLILMGGIPIAFGAGDGRVLRSLRPVGVRAGLMLAAAALVGDVAHVAGILQVPWFDAWTTPFFGPLLHTGLSVAWLWIAAAGLVAAVAWAGGTRAAPLGALASLTALAGCIWAVPVLHSSGAWATILAAVAGISLAIVFGRLPFTLRQSRPANISVYAFGILGLCATGGLLGLALRHNLASWIAFAFGMGPLLVLATVLRRRPLPAVRWMWVVSAEFALLVSLLAIGRTAVTAPMAERVLAPISSWAWTQSAHGATLSLQTANPGPNTLRLRIPGSNASEVSLVLSDRDAADLQERISVHRTAPGTFIVVTDALSLVGNWTVQVPSGPSFAVTLTAPSGKACVSGFVGFTAAVAHLGSPVTALAVTPNDPTEALAATATDIYRTRNSGLNWTPVPTRPAGTISALAIGRYGAWYALTAQGVMVSNTSGATWSPLASLPGAATAMYLPLFPSGNPGWAVSGGLLHQEVLQLNAHGGYSSVWRAGQSLPGTITSMVSLPAVSGSPPLLAGGPNGLWQSSNGGQSWRNVTVNAIQQVVLGPNNTAWAVETGGIAVYTWSSVEGWQPNQTAIEDPPGTPSSVAVAQAGNAVFAADPDQGLFATTNGGNTWQSVGCPTASPELLAGTYWPDTTTAPGTPALVYVADASGDLVALSAP